MADSVLSKLSVQIEAEQARLDRDLDQAERKAKKSGDKIEESLSLGGVASKLLAAFAALGAIEAGFKGITSVTQVLAGDLQSALDTIETLPFGLGPAIGAARDFFEVISGSREEAERLAAEWAKVAEEIKGAQSEIDALAKAQQEADTSAVDSIEQRRQRVQDAINQYTDLINQLKAFDAAQRSGLRFEGGEQGPTAVRGFAGADVLKQIGIEAEDVDQAIRELRERIEKGLKTGTRATLEDFLDFEASKKSRTDDVNLQRRREQLQADGRDIALARLDALEERRKALIQAQSDLEREAIEDLYQERLKRIDDELAARKRAQEEAFEDERRRAFEQSQRRVEQFKREQEQRAREAKAEAEQAKRDSFIRAQGFGADEFLRTSFEAGTVGKPQEVKDPAALQELQQINVNLENLGRVSAQPAVLT